MPSWLARDEQGRVIDVNEDVVAADSGAHPDLAEHDALGLATDADLATHAATPHGGSHPDLATHDGLGLATDAELSTHAATAHGTQAHAISGASHTGTLDHSALANQTANQHHNQAHAIGGADHTGSLTAADVGAAAASHAHLDADIPAAIARDSEVTSAIADHAGTPHGGSLPAGLIVMWGGLVANIPAGWLLCDGTNGTPDLRDRFIKGANGEAGGTGGAATHTHAGHTDHAALTHAGATVGNHAFTQPSAHSDHAALAHSAHAGATVANHTDVLNHVHPENRNSATTGGLDGWAAGDTSTNTPLQTGYVTGNPTANGVAAQVHTVGQASAHTDHAAQSHSAHAGGAVDAHSVGQASQHAAQSHSAHDSPNSEPAYFALCFIQKS